MVLWSDVNCLRVVQCAMFIRRLRSGDGVYVDVPGMRVSDVWISASEWNGGGTAVYGKFAARTSNCSGMDDI